MSKVISVRFKNHGKCYEFDCGHFVLKKGDMVLVVTEEGPAVGRVCTDPQPRADHSGRPLKKVFRLATEEEVKRHEEGWRLEEEVRDYCLQKVKEYGLPMRLVSVERRFDGSKIVVYFTSDGRVDFRQLVKDLVARFRTRIEMRQIGVRHQAKMVGGLGSCGRPLCCTSFLSGFAPVTIKMAKEQDLSLNPSKISGMCGRLMCCLTYEHAVYAEAKASFPKMGKRVMTPHGPGKTLRVNVLREKVVVLLDSGREVELGVGEVGEEAPPKPVQSTHQKKKKRKRSNQGKSCQNHSTSRRPSTM